MLINLIELATVRLGNAEGVPSENSQRHSLELDIALTLILKSISQSVSQIFKKLDRRFTLHARCLDRYWLEDEASAQHSELGVFPNLCGVRDEPSGERGSNKIPRCKGIDARCVPDEITAAWVWVHYYAIWSLFVSAVKARWFEHGRYPGWRKTASNDVI